MRNPRISGETAQLDHPEGAGDYAESRQVGEGTSVIATRTKYC